MSMRTHVSKTVAACFASLRQLRSIRRSVPRSVLQSLVSSLVLQRLDYGDENEEDDEEGAFYSESYDDDSGFDSDSD